ncbi:MAG TPA: VacJ family lipoprotein [Candidatus Binatia bacterium]|nr:VacJ family lipoprotein [Candidatus Binatia bacterium]
MHTVRWRIYLRASAAASLLMASACAHTPADDPSDPLEAVNRKVYVFNETADRYLLRPVAKGYDKAMPGFARTGVSNFFDNLFYPRTIVNDLLQGKLQQFGEDLARFVVNSTFGVAGLFDVAAAGGLEAHAEDFGQTLGFWGLGPGWYLMLPLIGPTDNRDLVGRGGDWFTNPLNLDWVPTDWNLAANALNTVEERAQFFAADRLMEQQLDRYAFVRTLYLQRRMNLVYDGNPPPEELFGVDPEDEAPP